MILGCTELGNVSIISSLPYGVTRQLEDAACTKIHRVVITGVPTDVDEESIRETTGAVEVRRILKRVALSDVRTPTTAMILGFSCSVEEIPARVQVGYSSFKTRVYIPQVTRCYKCQKFGHFS